MRRPGSPAELARRLDPKFRVTPTIRLLSDVAVRSFRNPDERDVVSTPPRTGKSQTAVIWNVVWALMENPDLKIVVVAYGDDLAQTHSREARKIINEHQEFLGYRLAQDKTAVGRWRVDGHEGGLLAAGINSGVTGFGADCLLIDDPVKDQAEADSKAHRNRILNEYRSTLAPRVHPGGSVIVIQTRWHEADLTGSLLAQEPDVWRHTNIPAVSEAGVPDALGRLPGVTMISALGFTPEHYAAMRRTSGERTWHALYQGVPSAPEGGLVKASWLEGWRLPAAPSGSVLTVVGVDPADSGQGDSCGIVAASLTSEGVTAVIADVSAPLTSDAWARAAVRLAVDVGASEISVESFAAGETYRRVVREALASEGVRRPIRVTAWPPKGSGRGRGDAMARSAALLQGLEVGTVRLAGHFPKLEDAAVLWQAGQHQPDQLAALVVAHDVLIHSVGREWSMAGPQELGGSSAPAGGGSVTGMSDWMSRRVG
ncbi:terminase large subunit domain-containing protein [Mycobacterium yunnanensis]|uniref:terminase large subunit domain-containing protein n=1 Tax=Mycobacterium yunnanensis TaxID=368477 RepID=UPI00355705B9